MRRLILHMSVSLDGFTGRPDGSMDWMRPRGDRDHSALRHQANVELFNTIGTIVTGRGAYEQMVQAWPGTDSPMGRLMNTLPKVIFSDSLDAVEWENARLNERPLEEEIAKLKAEPGGAIVAIGGGHIAHSLIRAHLVDEFRLTVHPVAFGEGISLMHGLPEPQRFELVSATVFADGTIGQVLRPA